MNIVPAKVRQVLADESGASIVEYGLLIVGVIVVAAAAMALLNDELTGNNGIFSGIGKQIDDAKTEIKGQ